VAAVLAAGALLLTGCSGDDAPPAATPPPSAAPVAPSYDVGLEPASAVLALVPDAAVTLTVTDFDTVRESLGLESVTSTSPVAEQDAFLARADAEAPLLARGLLRQAKTRLRAEYSLSRTDVSWEAHFFDAAGAELGWALGLRPGTDMTSVQRAATDGIGAFDGATVRAADLLVVKGTTDDGFASWAADDDTRALVGLPASATYLRRGCVSSDPVPTGLEPLEQYSVQLESSLATARLGGGRVDLFERMRLAQALPAFSRVFEGGVADPLTGRIGFRMTDPPAAAGLVMAGTLPFAACG
jgi:hypothetical protein